MRRRYPGWLPPLLSQSHARRASANAASWLPPAAGPHAASCLPSAASPSRPHVPPSSASTPIVRSQPPLQRPAPSLPPSTPVGSRLPPALYALPLAAACLRPSTFSWLLPPAPTHLPPRHSQKLERQGRRLGRRRPRAKACAAGSGRLKCGVGWWRLPAVVKQAQREKVRLG